VASTGPRPTTEGQVEQILDGEVVGAVQAIAAHPTNPDVLYIAAVNGGIWRTANGMATRPTWQPLTDLEKSASFGALGFDPTDSAHRTLVAGTGRFSSYLSSGGGVIGVLRTTDGGATWATLFTDALRGLHITGVAARGGIIVISSNNGGIHRSTDTGITWKQVSGSPGAGLPDGVRAASKSGMPGLTCGDGRQWAQVRPLGLPCGSLPAGSALVPRPGRSDLAVRCAGQHDHVDSAPQPVLGGIYQAQQPVRRL